MNRPTYVPAFSVIIPVYNVEPYLKRCLDSILCQTFSDFELILVDDGSTDRSGEICDAYAEQNERIRVIHQENKGLSAARNTGLDHAQGTFVYFVDSDDYLRENLLERVFESFGEDTDLVTFNCLHIDIDGEEHCWERETGTFRFPKAEDRFDFILYHLFEASVKWEVWASAYRRERIEQYHLRFFDNALIFAEDQYFSVCFYAHAQEVVSIPDVLYVYEMHAGSLSMTPAPGHLMIGKMSRCAHEIYHYLLQFEDCRYLTDHFPLLYLAVIRNEVGRVADRLRVLPFEKVKREFMDYDDRAFFMEQTEHLLHYARQMHLVRGHRYATLKTLNLIRLIRGGSYSSFLIVESVLDGTRRIVRTLRGSWNE